MLNHPLKTICTVLLILVILAGLSFVGYVTKCYYYGGCFFGKKIEEPKIKKLVVRTGDTISREAILDWMGMAEGDPLFAEGRGVFTSELRDRCQKILRICPTLSSLCVMRAMDGSVEIIATERNAIARLDCDKFLAVDGEGIVFTCSPNIDRKILIRGCFAGEVEYGKFYSATPMGEAGLQFLRFVTTSESPIPSSMVQEIDIDHKDYIMVILVDGRRVKLMWEGMGREEEETKSIRSLASQLDKVQKVLTSKKGQRSRSFDATIMGKIYSLD